MAWLEVGDGDDEEMRGSVGGRISFKPQLRRFVLRLDILSLYNMGSFGEMQI